MIASSLEHQTPEQLYSTDPAHPAQGISTMKALALASQQGQKIYTITQANINTTLSKIQTTSLVKGDIMSAVQAGQSVTIHEHPIAISGWSGSGYMIVDPQTGSSAFIIGGVGNGGFFKNLGIKLQFWASWFLDFKKKHPMIGKAILGPIGVIIGTIGKLISLINECGSKSGIFAMVGLFIIWNVAFTIISIGLAGILGGAGMMAVSALEIYLERGMMNKLKEVYCLLRRKMRYA